MNRLLYGFNVEKNIIAVHPVGGSLMRLYNRIAGETAFHDIEFYPFFFLSSPKYLKDYPKKHWIKELDGDNYYKCLCVFTCWVDMWEAIRYVMEIYNENAPIKIESFLELPVLHVLTDPVAQFLNQSGRTLFKEMEFNQLHRLQIDIVAYTKHGFKVNNPDRIDDRIIVIALSDNRGWNRVINAKRKSEKEMLRELVEIIQNKDPDVIEGHNIFGFDLPYLITRYEINQIDFAIGRDGSSPHTFDTRLIYADRSKDYTSYEIAGRHIIDTFLLLQSYDTSKQEFENYSLKHVTEQFGIIQEERVYIPAERINVCWDNEPEKLARFCIQNSEATRALSDILSPRIFYQTQILPFNYGTVARLGSNSKIESILLREYLFKKHSIPNPELGAISVNEYSDIFYSGLLGPVAGIDVDSLYSSLMMHNNTAPKSDVLNICPSIMKALADHKKKIHDSIFRDEIKSVAVSLFGSFHKYISSGKALFNDFQAADNITENGRSILKEIIKSITDFGGMPINVDTNRIYFVPPRSIQESNIDNELIKKISNKLPSCIHLKVDGKYQRIFSYKKSNYALLDYNGKLIVRGSSIISKNLERFGRQFIYNCLSALMNLDLIGLHELYVKTYKSITDHKLSVKDFCRTELLRDNMEMYLTEIQTGVRNRTPNYEAALRSGINWKSGDRVSYYFIGDEANIKMVDYSKVADEWDPNFPDENIAYYLKRLDDFTKKFEDFFTPSDFHSIFTTDDLFGFSSKGIQIKTNLVKTEMKDIEEEEILQVDPKIWLDES